MFKFLGQLFDSNEKVISKLQSTVQEINALEPEYEKLSAEQLSAKTGEFRGRIKQATAELRQRLTEAQGQLSDTRSKLANPTENSEIDLSEYKIKQLEGEIEQLEKRLGEEESKVLDDILPYAFAAVREAAKRTIGQRHYDVQLIGGMVLHQGKIAEMKTGEGKTLVATLPLYLNALTGKGCHLATVNDYLARRDPYWMGPIYHALGLTVASIYPTTASENAPSRIYDPTFESGDEKWQHFRPVTRREAYLADIIYGTSSEMGFDYLRDNMVLDLKQCVQRELNYAIVDEVDNLLIDEARTPLIISGPAEEAGEMYQSINDVVARMKAGIRTDEPTRLEEHEEEDKLAAQNDWDYIAYEKNRTIKELAHGQEKLARAFRMKVEDLFGGEGIEEKSLSFEDAKKRNDIRSISRKSMMAHTLYRKDRDYVVKDGEVIIVDEFTGRLMFGRRYSEGLHQTIEAKERVKVQRETLTYATITIQNYFRMYQKLGGMTGTAVTEAEEFHRIYKLEVVVIPTHKPMVRADEIDRIYKSEEGKFKAVAKEIEELHKQQRPVLVGTVSIEKSERLSEILKRRGVTAQILNAKYHEKEAGIIAQAGRLGAVTVATNMAGRGVDIILGGIPEGRDLQEWQKEHDKIVMLGGLHVVGTERHEARRIDNQLRGRAGRQGDPGSSRFYVSLEDDIVRRFGGDRIKGLMEWAGMDENTPIENKLISGAIQNAQVKTESYHFDIRKNLVEFDDVVNTQRKYIYEERGKILGGCDLKSNILDMVKEEIKGMVESHMAANQHGDGWNPEALLRDVVTIFPLPPQINVGAIAQMQPKELEEKLGEVAEQLYEHREKELGAENMRILERLVMLRVIDSLWIEHLTHMDDMRQQASWRTLQQMKAVDAYKIEGYKDFQTLLEAIRHDLTHTIFHVNIVRKESTRQEAPRPKPSPMAQVASAPQRTGAPKTADGKNKVGRNDPCPCGSGKKYKHCCGK